MRELFLLYSREHPLAQQPKSLSLVHLALYLLGTSNLASTCLLLCCQPMAWITTTWSRRTFAGIARPLTVNHRRI